MRGNQIIKVMMTDEEIRVTLELLSRAQISGKEVPAYAQVYKRLADALAAQPEAMDAGKEKTEG